MRPLELLAIAEPPNTVAMCIYTVTFYGLLYLISTLPSVVFEQ